MPRATILLIDDDLTLLDLLADYLRAAGYQVLTASDGAHGQQQAHSAQPDLIVLDVMMPGVDGWTVCQQLRAVSAVPIILLTARSMELDKLRGFRLGVDDYITKPFSFAELVARMGAVLARTRRSAAQSEIVTSGDLTIDMARRRVLVAERVIDLTPTEYRLLETLARQLHRPVATEALLLGVWGAQYAGEVERVKHFIWALRKKIEADPGNPQHLRTERGFGYRLD